MILMLMSLMITLTAFPQSGDGKQLTKFEEFSSKTGSIIKLFDYSLPKLSLNWGGLETGIRVMKANPDFYFCNVIGQTEPLAFKNLILSKPIITAYSR